MSTEVKRAPAPRRLSRTEQRELSRSRLISAAREMIAAGGYEAMQLEAVAGEVGLTKGSVYSIFGSKLELLLAVLQDSETAMAPTWEVPLAASGSVEDVLALFIDGLIAYVAQPWTHTEFAFEADLFALSFRHPRLGEVRAAIDGRINEIVATAFTGRTTRNGTTLTAAQARRLATFAQDFIRGMSISAMSSPTPLDRDLVVAALEGVVARL